MITTNPLRVGRFTSSEIWRIAQPGKRDMTAAELAARPKSGKGSKTTTVEDPMTFSEAGMTYIEEKAMEVRLNRSLNSEVTSRPTSWGNLVEARCFELLGIEYKISSTETVVHPTIPYWSGSQDGNKFDPGKTVFDIKSPYTLKSFCTLADCIIGFDGIEAMNRIRQYHADGDKFWFQLVSNAIITESKYAELIAYMPMQKELDAIRDLANYSETPNKFAWINFGEDADLPFLPNEGCAYKNMYIVRFEVPQSEKEFLTTKVKMAGSILEGLKNHEAQTQPAL